MKATRKPRRSKHRFLWVTDPWDTLDLLRDTTLRLAEEALTMEIENHWADVRSIRFEQGAILLDSYPLCLGGKPLLLGDREASRPSEFTAIHYRVDPPVDLAYLHPLQLLTFGTRESRKTSIINPPELLFSANEKLEPAWLGDLMPPTTISSRWEILEAFGKKEGRTVIKPLHQAQSKGVELLSWTSAEEIDRARSILSQATDQFKRPVLLQKYLKGIKDGEQRLWFIDGRLLAHARKLPLQGDFRVNMDQGSRLAKSSLSEREKKAASRVSKHLKANRIRLAAVDLIEGYVTDFNFTSPGLVRQMESLLNENLARKIIRSLSTN